MIASLQTGVRKLWIAFLTGNYCTHDNGEALEIIEEFYVWHEPFWNREKLTKDDVNPTAPGYNLVGKVYHQQCQLCKEIIKTRV